MDNEFYQIATECHEDRIMKEKNLQYDLDRKARFEFSSFRIWCRVYKNSEFSEQNFKEYVSKIKNIDFWTKKKIAELFFGYTYTYDSQTDKWTCHKS